MTHRNSSISASFLFLGSNDLLLGYTSIKYLSSYCVLAQLFGQGGEKMCQQSTHTSTLLVRFSIHSGKKYMGKLPIYFYAPRSKFCVASGRIWEEDFFFPPIALKENTIQVRTYLSTICLDTMVAGIFSELVYIDFS